MLFKMISPILLIQLLAACTSVSPMPSNSGAVSEQDPWHKAGQTELAQALQRRNQSDKAKNVIVFIGDGMSIATVNAARILAGQSMGQPGEEHLLSFEKFPHVALAKTYNTNAQVSDSAGTATAILSGVKTIMGVVGVDSRVVRGQCDGLEEASVPTLLELAEQHGLASGVISTARITHATPAAAYAHASDRAWESSAVDNCADIASQLVAFSHGNGPDVVLGGGRSPFMPTSSADPEYSDKVGWRRDGRNLLTEWQELNGNNAKYVWNKKQFDQINPDSTAKLLGLFEPSHMQYEADRNTGDNGEPSIAEMVEKAIQILSSSAKGYFLLVEGGRIDHAHHESNAYRALHDTIAMADAVAVARRMTKVNETLIVVTADHGHVMEISGYPTRGNPILGKVISVNPDGSPASNFAVDATGLPYTTLIYGNGPGHVSASDEQPAGVKHYPHDPSSFQKDSVARPDLTEVDTEHANYLQESAIPRTSETHSGTDVAIYADGPGAFLFQGVHEQNYIYHVMAHALLGHR